MQVLALDSSTDWLSVAVGDGRVWHERSERTGVHASERVLPFVREVLAEAGLRLHDLDGVAFGAGPGAFTGVRIACGVAQGLAFGADLPVVGVPTLLALAQLDWQRHGSRAVLACLDARMREVYVAAYRRDDDRWSEAMAPMVCKPDDVVAPPGEWRGCGDGFAAYPALAARLRVHDVDTDVFPAAAAIGALALPRLAHGEGVAADAAEPLYVRHRVALTTAERDAGLRL